MSSPAPSGGPELLAFLNTLEAYNKSVGVGAVSTDYLETIATVINMSNRFVFLLIADICRFFETSTGCNFC